MLLTNMEHFLYILNYVIKHGFLIEILADYTFRIEYNKNS